MPVASYTEDLTVPERIVAELRSLADVVTV
jgi:hypothetical protein